MDRVEGLCLRLAQLLAFLGDDAKTGRLEAGIDLAGNVAARSVGLDDREGSLEGHGFPFSQTVESKSAANTG